MILLTEYHASSIRLWRVILLRSDIRLAPSGIRFASFRANRIPLKPQGFNITIASAIISLRRSRNITLVFSADLCYNEANEKPSSERKVARRSRDGRILRDFRGGSIFLVTHSPSVSFADSSLPEGAFGFVHL